MRLLTTKRFEKDLKRALKRGKDLDKLWKIFNCYWIINHLKNAIERILYQATMLKYGSAHIAPDWLLIWNQEVDQLVLSRTGTHSDLF